jgi:hypothetical protein
MLFLVKRISLLVCFLKNINILKMCYLDLCPLFTALIYTTKSSFGFVLKTFLFVDMGAFNFYYPRAIALNFSVRAPCSDSVYFWVNTIFITN